MEAKLDRFGRIVIPKRIRDDLGLFPGQSVRISEDDGEVRLTPCREGSGLTRKEGVLVFTGSPAGDVEGAVRRTREERLDAVVIQRRR